MKIPAKTKQRSSIGVVVGALAVVAIGVGGYLALARKPAPAVPPQPQAGPTVAPPAATPVETVRVVTQPPSQPRRGATPPPAPPPAPVTAQGFSSGNANPPGTPFIAGRHMGSVPVIEEPGSPGRHTIRVERAGFKTKTETVEVSPNATVRRTYVLDQEGPE